MKLDIDTKQRIITGLLFALEFYKILMGTFLIAFVPQSCGEDVCTVTENVISGDFLKISSNIFNAITFLFVLNFYRSEIQRENWCITYLDIDESKPNDNLDTQIEGYPEIKTKMAKLNNNYLRDAYLALGFLGCNFILSSVSIGYDYVGSNTATSIISFLLLVLMKLAGALNVGKESVRDEHALSSYMKTYKTYNVIDNDYIKCNDIKNKVIVQEVEESKSNEKNIKFKKISPVSVKIEVV